MFTSTFELITLAASNSHILFCFCNLIIAILLIGTKPIFGNFHRQVTIPPPVMGSEGSHNVVDYNEKGTPVTQSVTVDDTEDYETAIVDRDDKENVSTHDKEEEEEEEEVDEGDDDRDGDELRRRVEEFIDKINKAWKAEKLGHIPIYST